MTPLVLMKALAVGRRVGTLNRSNHRKPVGLKGSSRVFVAVVAEEERVKELKLALLC